MTSEERKQLLQNKSLEQIQKILYKHYRLSLSIPQIKREIERGGDFSFSNNKSANNRVDEIIRDTVRKMEIVITSSAHKGFNYGKISYEEDVNKVLKTYATDIHREAASEKYKTFDRPKLSERVWDLVNNTKHEIELLTQNAIKQGLSANDLSKEIRKYLNNPNTQFKRVRNKETGEFEWSELANKYNPGQGVYRSAYKNAMRLARTEINAAYREAEWLQYQNDPLVVGIKISLSNNHTTLHPKTRQPIPLKDVCDELKGVYPKTFKWKGWHPQCRCVMTPILCNKREFGKHVRDEGYFPKQITKMPKGFTEWIEKNNDRIKISNNRGTLPNFIKDNAKIVGIKVNPINTDAGRKIIQDSFKKYNSYMDEWIKVYFDKQNGGFNVYHEKHNFAKTGGGGDAEKIVGNILAKYNGKQVEFLKEGEGKSPDIKFDNQTWDIKYIDNASVITIRNHIKDARKAENAIFYFTKEQLADLNKAIFREVGNFTKQNKIDQLPNIYYIDKNKILRLLWKK